MKVIFLDIDGVLNYRTCKARCPNYKSIIGIEDSRVERLAKIVKATNAELVLTSTWKLNWLREDDEQGIYLDRQLAKYGLHIIDFTEDDGWNRWSGIKDYLDRFSKCIKSYVILDDEIFQDYIMYNGLTKMLRPEVEEHLVKTSFYSPDGGLQEEDVQKAIDILNKFD